MEPRGKRSVVASGKTVEDAITNGLAILGVRRDQVDIDIIHPGSRGLLGIGAEDARVQLVVKAPPAARPAAPPTEPEPPRARVERPERSEQPERVARVPAVKPAQAEPVPPAPRVVRAERPERAERRERPERAEPALPAGRAERTEHAEGAEGGERSATIEEVTEAGREILSKLLSEMGFEATVEAAVIPELGDEGEEPPLVLNIRGDDLGILIGRRGETLAALQYLVRLMVSHRVKHWSDLLVDVENYRTRRRRALETLAARVAERAVASGHTQALEPMPAYERRMVHIALRNHPLVTTHSVGVGEKRKVTIIPKK